MKKYEAGSIRSMEMYEFDNTLYMIMDDGVQFRVNLYYLSDEDIDGLKTIEDYYEIPEVFDRLMKLAVAI